MKAKMEHIAVIIKNSYLAAEWFKSYFEFEYYESDAPEKYEKQKNTRTTLKNPNGDMLELFSYKTPKAVSNGIITHIVFFVDSIEEYYNRLKELKSFQLLMA